MVREAVRVVVVRVAAGAAMARAAMRAALAKGQCRRCWRGWWCGWWRGGRGGTHSSGVPTSRASILVTVSSGAFSFVMSTACASAPATIVASTTL